MSLPPICRRCDGGAPLPSPPLFPPLQLPSGSAFIFRLWIVSLDLPTSVTLVGHFGVILFALSRAIPKRTNLAVFAKTDIYRMEYPSGNCQKRCIVSDFLSHLGSCVRSLFVYALPCPSSSSSSVGRNNKPTVFLPLPFLERKDEEEKRRNKAEWRKLAGSTRLL